MNPRKALRALVEQPRYTIIPGAGGVQVLKEDGDTTRIEDRLASFKDRERVVNATWWSDRERRYLAD